VFGTDSFGRDWRQCQVDQNLNPNTFSWHQYGPSTAEQPHLPYSYVISPGFWHWTNTGTPELARLSDSAWRVNIQDMVNSGAKWQLVTTYNEWQEGTGVEPAIEFTPDDLYLEALHDELVGAAPSDFVVYAAGDIACKPGANPSESGCRQQYTSDIILSDPSEDLVLPLGDNQYETGDFADFMLAGKYNDTWGRLLNITRPATGNHEYCNDIQDECGAGDDGAEGYEQYFGPSRAGPVDLNYYSFDQGGWHFVAVNSQCGAGTDPSVGCAEGGTMNNWLENDLAATTEDCTIAYYHHPRFSVGSHGDDDTGQGGDYFQDLYNGGVDIVLAGHDHSYQRFNLMNGSGAADANGIRQFVVGTGGKNLTTVGGSTAATAGVATLQGSNSPDGTGANNGTFGVLKLTLGSGSYTWEFRPDINTGTYTDSGSGTCSNT
jgi:acid phosphatase type 7